MNVEPRGFLFFFFLKGGVGSGGEPEGKEVPVFRENPAGSSGQGCEGRLWGLRRVNPGPHQEETEQAAAPRKPCRPRGRGCSGREGAPRAAGGTQPSPHRPTRPLPGLPASAPRGRAPDPAAANEPLGGRRRQARREQLPFPQGPGRPPANPRPTSSGEPRAASARRPLREAHSARGLTATPSGRQSPSLSPNFRREAPSPRPSACNPRRPAAIEPRGQTAASHLQPRGRTRPAAPPGARFGPRAPGAPRRTARGGSRRKRGLSALRVTLAHPSPEETLAGRGPRGRGWRAQGPGYTAAGRAPCRGSSPAVRGRRGSAAAPAPP